MDDEVDLLQAHVMFLKGKGYSIGGARVSEKHAGFLINNGNSSRDYLNLVKKIQEIVEERVGVRLEPEIRILGEEA